MELAPGTLPPPRFTRFSSLLADHSSCQDVWLPGPSGGRSKPLSLLGGQAKALVRNPPRDRFLLPQRKRQLGPVLSTIWGFILWVKAKSAPNPQHLLIV